MGTSRPQIFARESEHRGSQQTTGFLNKIMLYISPSLFHVFQQRRNEERMEETRILHANTRKHLQQLTFFASSVFNVGRW